MNQGEVIYHHFKLVTEKLCSRLHFGSAFRLGRRGVKNDILLELKKMSSVLQRAELYSWGCTGCFWSAPSWSELFCQRGAVTHFWVKILLPDKRLQFCLYTKLDPFNNTCVLKAMLSWSVDANILALETRSSSGFLISVRKGTMPFDVTHQSNYCKLI